MKRLPVLYAALICVFALMKFPVRADAPADVIESGKRRIAKVYNRYEEGDFNDVVNVDSAGSAFCITKSGYFVTDEHVVHNVGDVRIGIETAPHNVRFFDARVIARESKLDLAVLKVDNAPPFLPLSIAVPTELKRGMHVTAIGYPAHGDDVDPNSLAWYTPSVHGGSIKELVGAAGQITDVITDTGIGHGASGCPLLDDSGKLVGILQRGKRGSNLNLSKSAASIRKYLATPDLRKTLQTPDIHFASNPGPQSNSLDQDLVIETQMVDGLIPLKELTAKMSVDEFPESSHTFGADIHPNGRCDFHIRARNLEAPQYSVALTTAAGAGKQHRNLLVKDQRISVGDRQVKLTEVSRITQSSDSAVILRNGERIVGRVKGLESIEAVTNGKVAVVDLSTGQSIAVRNRLLPHRELRLELTISRGAAVVGKAYQSVTVQGLPPAQHGQPIVLACGSAWATNNTGASTGGADSLSAATRNYIRNIMDVLVAGAPFRVLVLSDHWTFGAPFVQALRSLGHQVTVAIDTNWLDDYDVLFVGGHEVDQQALIGYVRRGGKVYLSGGADASGGQWNGFLSRFGLYSQADTKQEAAPGSGYEYPDLFVETAGLTTYKMYNIVRTKDNLLEAQTICTPSLTNGWAIYKGNEKLGPTPPQIAASNAILAAEAVKVREHAYEVNHRTVDQVLTGNAASEAAHDLKGENLVEGEFDGSRYRRAVDGGFLSYTLKVDPAIQNNLLLTTAWTEGSPGDAVIYLNDRFMGRIDYVFLRPKPGFMFKRLYELPREVTAGRNQIVVRFQGEHGNSTPQLFECKINRTVAGVNDKPKPILEEDQMPLVHKEMDSVSIGETENETNHQLAGEKTDSSTYNARHGRQSMNGGWFSYTLKVSPEAKAALEVRYPGRVEGGHDFDILVDGKHLSSVSLNNRYPNRQFFSAVYAIPESWTKGKSSIVVRFSAHQANTAGAIFACKIIER